MVEETRRPGRQWNTPAQGSSVETNELVHLLRTMVNERGLSIRQLQAEMEKSDVQYSSSTIARRLGGDNLENDWHFVLGVIEATTDDPGLRERRFRAARRLWTAARDHPTPVSHGPEETANDEEARSDHDVIANGAVTVIPGGVIHGTVNITVRQYPSSEDPEAGHLREELRAARREIADLRSRLAAAERQDHERRTELRRLRSALDAAHQLDASPEEMRTVIRRSQQPESLPPGN
ncbi:hypothetical protein [Kitasatospora sp. NPDC057500]|uniref:hypothetical protein n=1 Tax=Kitasatospora sp. NPDC057500 TaxID=3346151 RepID=UPI0036803F08